MGPGHPSKISIARGITVRLPVRRTGGQEHGGHDDRRWNSHQRPADFLSGALVCQSKNGRFDRGYCCCTHGSSSPARRSEQLFLVGRSVNLQQIPLIAALVEAHAPLGIPNQLELRGFQLEVLHVELLIHAAGIEQELVGGDGEQGPGQFPDARLVEIAIGNPPLLPVPW